MAKAFTVTGWSPIPLLITIIVYYLGGRVLLRSFMVEKERGSSSTRLLSLPMHTLPL